MTELYPLKIDLHVHTSASRDSLTTPQDVLHWAERQGMDALAVTDHNTIEAALAMREMSPLPIIVGQEISTTCGELIGYFVSQPIPPGLSPLETIQCIHAQGGLVSVPHPVDRVRSSAIGYHHLVEIIGQVDMLEVLNARVTFVMDNHLAQDLAKANRLPMTAGSDAHTASEVGRAYVELPMQDQDAYQLQRPAVFLHMLRQAQVKGSISSPLVHMGSTYAKAAKSLAMLRTPSK